jgi:hypothetical protein
LFPVTLVPLLFSFTYSLFTGLLAQKGLFFLESSCLTLVSSFIYISPLSILCSASLVVTNSFSFSLLWKVLLYPSVRKDTFAWWTRLGWQLLSFRSWIIPFHYLLGFRVWVEKSIILMGLPLYVTCLLSFAASRNLSLFCLLGVLTMMCLRCFFFGSDSLVFCKIPAPRQLSLSWG